MFTKFNPILLLVRGNRHPLQSNLRIDLDITKYISINYLPRSNMFAKISFIQ